jgi:hypothetical protein
MGFSGIPTAHIWWRVFFVNNNGSGQYMGLQEIDLLDVFGVDVAANKVVMVSSEQGVPSSQKLTNGAAPVGSTANDWFFIYGSTTNQWVSLDFGASPKSVVGFAITANAQTLTVTPNNFYLQWSDNNVNWNTVINVTNQTGWGGNEIRTFYQSSL